MWNFLDKQLTRVTLSVFLAVVTTIGFFLMLGLMFFHPIPEASRSVIEILFGAVATAFGTIIGYHFGSSSGSAKKTDAMIKATPDA